MVCGTMSIRSHNQFGAPGVSPWQVKNVFNHGRSRNHSLLDVVVFQHHEALVLREVSNKEPWPLWDRSWWDRKERPVSLQTLGQCSDPWPWGLHFCLFLNGASRCRIPGSNATEPLQHRLGLWSGCIKTSTFDGCIAAPSHSSEWLLCYSVGLVRCVIIVIFIHWFNMVQQWSGLQLNQ